MKFEPIVRKCPYNKSHEITINAKVSKKFVSLFCNDSLGCDGVMCPADCPLCRNENKSGDNNAL